MVKVLRDWLHRYFSDEQALVLALVLLLGFSLILSFGRMLAPALAALVLAFMLQGLVARLERWRVPHLLAVTLVFCLFVALLLACLFGLIPLVWRQSVTLLNELPRMLAEWQGLLLLLPQRYPQLLTETQVLELIASTRGLIAQGGQWLLSSSLASVPLLLTAMVYLVLVPLLVFFFLKDRSQLVGWFSGFLPAERGLLTRVWREVNQQSANYIRGKVMEIFICGVVTWVCFAFLGLNYSALLALLVGLSVVVPYIGAVVVTLPVALIGLFQWGWGDQFIWLIRAIALSTYVAVQGPSPSPQPLSRKRERGFQGV